MISKWICGPIQMEINLNIFFKLSKIRFIEDASEFNEYSMLTNAYYQINITEDEFLKIKSDWLIKNKNRNLIEEYLIKNQILNLHPELSDI